jgi:hypothetical protein
LNDFHRLENDAATTFVPRMSATMLGKDATPPRTIAANLHLRPPPWRRRGAAISQHTIHHSKRKRWQSGP